MSGQEGAQMVEYGFLLSGIAVVATLAVLGFGDRVSGLFGLVQALFQ